MRNPHGTCPQSVPLPNGALSGKRLAVDYHHDTMRNMVKSRKITATEMWKRANAALVAAATVFPNLKVGAEQCQNLDGAL